MQTRHYLLLGIGVLVGLVAIVGFQFFAPPYEFQGSVIDPPIPAEDFNLTNQYGNTFQLSDHFGEVVLIFFGYTNCPDVCPVT